MRDYVDRRITSPTWSPPPQCNQGPFLERPGNFSGLKSNIQIKNKKNKSAGPG